MSRKPSTDVKRIVIVGAGHAGVQVADSLRAMGYTDEIALLSDETGLPYQRPPLSKGFMLGEDSEALLLRGERFFAENGIDLRLGCAATRIDTNARCVALQDDTMLAYDELVLATGSSNRNLQARRYHGLARVWS